MSVLVDRNYGKQSGSLDSSLVQGMSRQLLEDEQGVLIEEPLWDEDLKMPNETCRMPAGWKPNEIVTDERGYSCESKNMHLKLQCCLSRMRYSCLNCNRNKGCCFEYARCVSCCMGNVTGASWDECRHKCRTSSASLLELANVRNWDPRRPRFCFRGWRAADSNYNGRDDSDLHPKHELPECVRPLRSLSPGDLEQSRKDGEEFRQREASKHPERFPPSGSVKPFPVPDQNHSAPGTRSSDIPPQQQQQQEGDSITSPPPSPANNNNNNNLTEEDEFVEV